MKIYINILIAVLFIAASMIIISGCEYDVTQPQWYQDYHASPIPVITDVQPAQAVPGVNTITIVGENFAVLPDTNDIYFNNLLAEPVSISATSITVRRPNLVTDSCIIKVVPRRNALVVAKYDQLYKIDPVMELYGNFLDNIYLTSIAVDSADNIYVTYGDNSKDVYRVSPEGVYDSLGKARADVWDMAVGPDNRLYMMTNNRDIQVLDPATKTVDLWLRITGKNTRFGDFDQNGYFYVAGTRTDLIIVAPDLSNTLSGFYAGIDVQAVHEHGGYLYVAGKPRAGEPPPLNGIWRHSISAGGVLGDQELVLDFGMTKFADQTIRSLAFSANGTMFILTESTGDPLLVVDPLSHQVDYFYKDILPSYGRDVCWGNDNFVYMVRGHTDNNPALAEDWTVYRVDMGTTGD